MYGQEANPDTWKMAKMNMAIRGIDADLGPYNADTFTSDLHPTLKADFILANPPFNYHPWGQEKDVYKRQELQDLDSPRKWEKRRSILFLVP